MERNCIFCAIVAGESPASFVHRDDLVSAFMDIQPVTPGHVLVVPNEHHAEVRSLPDPLANRLFGVARRLARALARSGLRADGTNLFAADGSSAGQEVFHAHLHVIPRYADDGFVIDASAYRASPPGRNQLDESAARIRAAIQ